MEQSFHYSMEGRDLLLELRQDAEAALGRGPSDSSPALDA